MTSKYCVPDTWIVTQVKDVVESIDYGLTASANESPSGPRFLRITDIQNGRVDWDAVPSCDLRSKDVERYQLVDGDLVFARTGATTGKSFLIRNCPDRAVFASYLIRLRASAILDPRFLALCFQTADYWRQISETSTGTAQPGVNATKLNELWLSVAPEGEQRRIVEAVESYFTRLDDAVATLERVERNLKRYRASVLKAAVEGRLVPTEAALAKQEGRSYEPASVLLERILTERRCRWSESGKKGKYQEPALPDTINLPDIPEGWCWASFDALSLNVDGGNAATASSEPSERTILTSRAVRQGYIDFADARFLPKEAEQKTDPYIGPGDLLFTRLSGTLDYVGNCAVVPDSVPPRIEFPDRIFRARCLSGISRRYIQHCFADKTLRRQLERAARSTAGHQRISLSDLRMYSIPLPPLAEQERIVTEVDRALSIFADVDTAVQTSRSRSQRLRQSVLKWAFEGKLTDQDPKDEPASVLLERIKAERGVTKAMTESAPQRGAKKKQVGHE